MSSITKDLINFDDPIETGVTPTTSVRKTATSATAPRICPYTECDGCLNAINNPDLITLYTANAKIFVHKPKTMTASVNNNVSPLPKTFSEMGFENCCSGWEQIKHTKCSTFKEMAKKIITNNYYPSVAIRIGTYRIDCHMILLRCFSRYFNNLGNVRTVTLPEEKVSTWAFIMIYKWMQLTQPTVPRYKIAEFFAAANYLQVDDAIEQCWSYFSDDDIVKEDVACAIYLEALQFQQILLQHMMLGLIKKFFYNFVGSLQFLHLPVEEVVYLLSSNTIGVNREIEVFLTAIRWLSHNWPERKHLIIEVLKSVRFNLIPQLTIQYICLKPENHIIEYIVSLPEVEQLIDHGRAVAFSQELAESDIKKKPEYDSFADMKILGPKERQLIYDKNCSFHQLRSDPDSHWPFLTYKEFFDYLRKVRDHGISYWHNLKNMLDENGRDIYVEETT